MTPALALQIAASTMAVGALLEARWALRWWHRDKARALAILHLASAVTSIIVAAECLRRLSFQPTGVPVVLDGSDLGLLTLIFVLHTVTRLAELMRQQRADAAGRTFRRELRARLEHQRE